MEAHLPTELPPASADVVKMAAWMKSSGTSYLGVMTDPADALNKAELPAKLWAFAYYHHLY